MDRNSLLHFQFFEFVEVALRKESVDRNFHGMYLHLFVYVALRKESVDRNKNTPQNKLANMHVALRKESVDRNFLCALDNTPIMVALRKESVDRNLQLYYTPLLAYCRSPQGERG